MELRDVGLKPQHPPEPDTHRGTERALRLPQWLIRALLKKATIRIESRFGSFGGHDQHSYHSVARSLLGSKKP